MEPFIWMSVGAGGAMVLILMRLATVHSWSWVRAQLKQHAMDAESGFKQRVSAAMGDIEGRVKAAVDGELASIKAEIAALKNKVP
jgi:hypothetical protein